MPVGAATAARVIAGSPIVRRNSWRRQDRSRASRRRVPRIERWAAREFGAAWKDRISVVSDESRLAQVQKGAAAVQAVHGRADEHLAHRRRDRHHERATQLRDRANARDRHSQGEGAAQRHILWQFLCESVAITGVGSVIGLLLGVAAAFSITAIMRRRGERADSGVAVVSTVRRGDRRVGDHRSDVRTVPGACARRGCRRSTRSTTSDRHQMHVDATRAADAWCIGVARHGHACGVATTC